MSIFERTYKYLHITVNPKNCDGSNRNEDYLEDKLVETLDSFLIKKSYRYARAIEKNNDNVGRHYHFALYGHQKYSIKYIKETLFEILEQFYLLSENAYKRSIVIKHKSLDKLNLVAGGYLTKQYKDISTIDNNYCTNISDEEIVKFKEEYETIVSTSATNRFSVWVLSQKDTLTSLQNINKYYEAISIIIQQDEEAFNLLTADNFGKFKCYIISKYRITFDFNNIRKLHRQLLEFLISINKFTNKDYETLVNFYNLTICDEYKIIEDDNQYEQKSILNFWSIN